MQALHFFTCDSEDFPPAGMHYRRLGESDLHISVISLSLQCDPARYGSPFEQRTLIECALNLGINHFRLTPSHVLAESVEQVVEKCVGEMFYQRDEMLISAQVGFSPHGSPVGFGSRNHVLSSLDAILRRTGLESLDVLCAHRYDPSIPLEETMGALALAVHQGKARYVGLSGYAPAPARRAAELLMELGTPAIVCFGPFSMLHPWAEDGLLEVLDEKGIGFLSDAPLPGCLLSAASWLEHARCSETVHVAPARELPATVFAKLAASRGQSTASLALSWVLRKRQVASALVSVASLEQLQDYCAVVDYLHFTADELAAIDSCR
ncbi:NADP-dependent oxidoreductase domain containing protein [Actinobacteria bacterium OV450]|nr:NADP-dependent oxidoreductase domain containing protein [Actinobacteria bacterium OV450]